MTRYPAGTVVRYTREVTLEAPIVLDDDECSLYLGDIYIEDDDAMRHFEVLHAPLPKFRGGDIVRDAEGVTWCRAAGMLDDRWYLVHNHPSVISELMDRADWYNSDVDRTLVRTDELPRPITPVLRNGFPWKDDQ